MKVTRETKGFMPIIITLETEEEARFLYQLLKCPTSQIEALLKENGYELSSRLDSELWDKLDDVYKPDDC